MQKLNKKHKNKKTTKISIFTVNLRRFYAIALITVLFSSAVATVAFSTKIDAPSATYTVVIDAGHGGIDGGVVGKTSGVKESDLNLAVAKTLGALFERAGALVVYTRKNDSALFDGTLNFKRTDMKKRRKIILDASPDAVISIHMNFFAGAPYRRGAQCFFNAKEGTSKELAYAVQMKLNDEINKKYSGREYAPLSGDYYIINDMPCAAIIVECGFLSNDEDEKLLQSEEYRKQLSYQVFTATMTYLFTNGKY